jgi:hemerythrin
MPRSYTNYYHWITIFNFIHFLREEEYIEDATFKTINDHVIALKEIVMDADDVANKWRENEELQ